MDFIKKKNKIQKYAIFSLILLGILFVGSLLAAFLIFKVDTNPVMYGILIGFATLIFVASIFVFVFSFQVRAREYKIKNHVVQIYAGTKKTVLVVDDKVVNEVKVFTSIKKSLFYLLFKRKKLKLNTTILKKEFVVEVGAFNKLKVTYDGEYIEPTKK